MELPIHITIPVLIALLVASIYIHTRLYPVKK
jgi:hypothetical protein